MRSEKITVSLPVNISNSDIDIFKNKQDYYLNPLKIIYEKDVFITYSGLCINSYGMIKECHHQDEESVLSFQKEANLYINKTKKEPDNLIKLIDENTYLIVHHPWLNYYHWICEMLPRVFMLESKLEKLILLMPMPFKQIAYIKESLETFTFKDVYYIPNFKCLYVKHLCLPQVKPKCHSYYKVYINKIRGYYKQKNVSLPHTNYGERIYISRKKARYRKVCNEDEVIKKLKEYGFSIIYCEEHSFKEQIEIFANASYLISIHGAGLTNMIWMKNDSKILEFHKQKTNDNDRHSLVYWYLSDALGFKYFHQICKPTELNDDFFVADFIIDLKVLERNIKDMINC